MTTNRAVLHFDGPIVVFINVISRFTKAGHWLNADSVALNEFVTVAFFAIVWNFGFFVHSLTDAVTDVVFNNAEMAFFQNLFDGVPDVADVSAGLDLLDSLPHGGFGDLNHFLDGR